MSVVSITEAAQTKHAGLIAHALSMLESQPRAGDGGADQSGGQMSLMLCDGDETPVSARSLMVVSLERGTSLSLTRIGLRNFALTYDPAHYEATTAALVAATTQSGMPVCGDPNSLAMITMAERVAKSEIPVLIEGPTGTGKEVLSRFIHSASNRGSKGSSGPFIAVNCAAMPETMLEALLFGHRKGAYTGATEAAEGFFRAADGGTLLLDEIGELPLALQSKLLRTLQEGEVVPLGATKPVKIDVRIVACTNRDLAAEVAEGRFRADLYYRLNVFPLQMDALRERMGDIAPLAYTMLLRHSAYPGKRSKMGDDRVPTLSTSAMQKLAHHQWPGNVRELENVIRRALLLSGEVCENGGEIGQEHISFDRAVRPVQPDGHVASHFSPASALEADSCDESGNCGGKRLSDISRRSESQAILETLTECAGNRGATAKQLGISERTLRYRMADMREAGMLASGASQ